MHIPIFLVFYSTTFTILLLALIGLLLITPADIIYQSLQNGQPANVIIVAAAYLLTLLVAAFIYATRLYATRTYLAALPRSAKVPENLGGAAIRRVISAGLARAAAVAYAAHPRDLVAERRASGGQTPLPPPELFPPRNDNPSAATDAGQDRLRPAFGVIQHPGWTAPSTEDLPGVQFAPVIAELPHLLEAKAVSLAPPDPLAAPPSPSPPAEANGANPTTLPDPFAVAILQRPNGMDVRAYVAHLASIGTITDAKLAASFVAQYEYARFSGKALDEATFRRLMTNFAALLRSVIAPDPDVLHDLASFNGSSASPSSAPTPPSARSAPASLHMRPSVQGFRQERPVLPKRGNTTGAASAILHRLAAEHQDPRISQPRHPTSDLSTASIGPLEAPTASPAASTPLPATPTPHHTPFFTPYRTSISSNDGDRSAESSDADLSSEADEGGRDGTVDGRVDAFRHRRRKPRLPRRSTHSSSTRARTGRGLGLGVSRTGDSTKSLSTEDNTFMSFASDDSVDEPDGGSVIRRVFTAQETAGNSGSDAGSVVIRPEDHGIGGLLPVPVAVANGDANDGMGGAEMRMVEHD